VIHRSQLLADLQTVLRRLETDLLERSEEMASVKEGLRGEHQRARTAERTAQSYDEWRSDYITQMAAAWVLSCVFVRFLEDNWLIDPPKIGGPGERLARARDEHEIYFRAHPTETDREYLLHVFDELAQLPGVQDIFGAHNPIHELPNWLSGDAAGELLRFFQKIDANTGVLIHDFTDSDWNTCFLGDLYQDLSEAARKKYALLQTPEFVEEFILDRTLDPAIEEFDLEGFRMIDPACGSGHFLLGSFARLLNRWWQKEPGTNIRELVQRALNSVHGVDINPYAVAIARFRLLLAAIKACHVRRLADAPAFHLHLACGDSLIHGSGEAVQQYLGDWDPIQHVYQSEDLSALQCILRAGQYHAVVGNPPYITPKDSALNQAYRERYSACRGKYSLSVPFMQRVFSLAIEGGFTAQITANSFMKRSFGKTLIERFFPSAESSDLFGHDQRRFRFTIIVSIDPCCQLVRAQQAIRSRDRSLPMDPFRFDGIEPWAFAGQWADDDAHAFGTPFDLLMVLTHPVAHGLTAVPGGMVPDQQQGRDALGRALCRAPRQEIDRDGTHRTPRDKPEPYLLRLLRPRSPQAPIARQGLGIRISEGGGEFLSLILGVCLSPGMLVGLSPPTPPDFVAKAQGP
jgi:SAM-dependent methyltransferase